MGVTQTRLGGEEGMCLLQMPSQVESETTSSQTTLVVGSRLSQEDSAFLLLLSIRAVGCLSPH